MLKLLHTPHYRKAAYKIPSTRALLITPQWYIIVPCICYLQPTLILRNKRTVYYGKKRTQEPHFPQPCLNPTPLQTAQAEWLMCWKRSLYSYNIRQTQQLIPNIFLPWSYNALLLYLWDQTPSPHPLKEMVLPRNGVEKKALFTIMLKQKCGSEDEIFSLCNLHWEWSKKLWHSIWISHSSLFPH
jgi:hypothetical protein